MTSLVPAPPVLGYVNDKLRQARHAATHSLPPTRPGTAGTAASAPSRPRTADTADLFRRDRLRRGKTFLKDNECADTILPQPLPTGIPYVASFTTFDDLIERRILQQAESQQVHLSTEDVKLMYDAKCLDQKLKPSWEREVRFMELLSNHCKGNVFSLRENGLGHVSAEAVARVLGTNEAYSIVDLGGNRLRDAGAACVAQLLLINDTIVHLSLKSNDIGQDGGEALANALMENNTLTSLDLGGICGINRNHLGTRGAAAFGKMLKRNNVLCVLNVSSNGLAAEGIGLLAEGMAENTTLTRANLSSNNIGTEGAKILGSALENTALVQLDLQRNGINDKGVACVLAAMKFGATLLETLEELFLDSNDIREEGCRALARFIKASSKLRRLTLNQNHLAKGVHHLADALRETKTLQELHVADCLLFEAEGVALASAFAVNRSLQHLNVSKNRLADGGCRALCGALRANRGLLVLNLESNMIGDAGGEAVAQLLRDNAVLAELSLRQNSIARAGDSIADALRRNTSLRRLDFVFNDFSFDAFTAVGAALARNATAWSRQEAPRLAVQIEALGTAQSELLHIQEESDLERRGTKDRHDELLRRKDVARGTTENYRRIVAELEEQVKEVRARVAERRERLRAAEDGWRQETMTMEGRASGLNYRLEVEREKKERLIRDTERVRKELRRRAEVEREELRPLLDAYRKADSDRFSALSDARWQAESIAAAELKILAMRRQLARSAPVLAAPPATGPGASSSPRRAPGKK